MRSAIQGARCLAALAVVALCAGCPNQQGVPALASPSPIDFGSVDPGAGVQTRQLLIENIGGADLNVTDAGMVKNSDGTASSAGFAVGVPSEGTLVSGQKTSIAVTFTPMGIGFSRGLIQVTTDSSHNPTLTVPVRARVEVQPPPVALTLDFGAVPVLTRRTLSIQTTAAGDLAPPAIPSPGEPFQLGVTRADGGFFEQELIFTPTSSQSYSIQLVPYAPCSGCGQQLLTLIGQGIDALVFEDLDGGILSTFDTGSVVVGVDAGYRIQLVNQWNDQVTFNRLNDLNGTPFSASAPGGKLNPRDGVNVSLGFSPVVSGGQSASLVASYQVAGSQVLASAPLALVGRGISDRCELSWSPSDIFFGYVPAGATNRQRVSLSNDGALPCTVTNFAIFPAAEPFSVPLVAPITVPPFDGGRSFEVDFKPAPTVSPIHQRGATLTFDTGDPVNPDAGISLSGSLQLEAYGSSAWPKWHHDNGNTGLSPVDTSHNLGQLAWKIQVGAPPGVNAAFLQGPALDDTGAIYQFSGNNGLWGLHADGGTITSWSLPFADWIVLDGGFSVAGVESTPTLVGGSPWLAIATNQQPHALQRVLTFAGTPIADAGFGSSGPVAGFSGLDGGFDGGIYIADDLTSRVLRISGDGTVLQSWDLCGGGPVCALETFSGALADDGSSYWTGGLSWAVALAPDGTLLWSTPMSPGAAALTAHSAPVLLIASGIVYGVGSYMETANGQVGSTVVALNQADGMPLWEYPLPLYDPSGDSYPLGYSSPALRSDGTIVVGYHDGVYLFSPDGQKVGFIQDPTNSGVVGSAAIGADGTIYVGTLGGILLAIDDKACDGGGFCTRWEFPAGLGIGSSPAIGADGTIYFLAGGQVFAVH
jgi:PQQ-like domain